ncbi:hypothetical protein Anas_11402, partial [Armadillidium nasatum]
MKNIFQELIKKSGLIVSSKDSKVNTLVSFLTSQNCTTFRSGQQDSLVRLLLNIDELQPKIITFLTEKLLQLAYE